MLKRKHFVRYFTSYLRFRRSFPLIQCSNVLSGEMMLEQLTNLAC